MSLVKGDMTSGYDVTTFNTSYTMDDNNSIPTRNVSIAGGCESVHDIDLDKTIRLLILYLTISLNIVGSILVILWMVCNRRVESRVNQISRVNAFILNLTIADILVILLAVFPQLLWEYADRSWTAGPVMCRLTKFLQCFSMAASNYMLVVIAIDRHQAIRSPLKESLSVWKMAGAGWAIAVILSIPVLGVFRISTQIDGETRCENIFRERPHWHRQIWMIFVAVTVFLIPLVLLAVCYIRIFIEISTKAEQSSSKKKHSIKPGALHLQSTHSNSLPKAKVKTLKMTFVIIMVFIICSLPYFIVEMIMSFGNHCIISKKVYALFAGMAACNSATNPFVFLLFNARMSWAREILKYRGRRSQGSYPPGCTPTGSSVMTSHFTVHRNSMQSYRPFLRQDTKESTMEMQVYPKYV